MKVFVVGLVWLLSIVLPDLACAERMDDQTISQTTTAEQLVDSFTSAFTVTFAETSAAGCVWLLEEPTLACTSITTSKGGKRICRKAGEPDPVVWVFLASEGYTQQVCGKSENTGVVLRKHRR